MILLILLLRVLLPVLLSHLNSIMILLILRVLLPVLSLLSDLNSIMILLILKELAIECLQKEFKFHYDSINSQNNFSDTFLQ